MKNEIAFKELLMNPAFRNHNKSYFNNETDFSLTKYKKKCNSFFTPKTSRLQWSCEGVQNGHYINSTVYSRFNPEIITSICLKLPVFHYQVRKDILVFVKSHTFIPAYLIKKSGTMQITSTGRNVLVKRSYKGFTVKSILKKQLKDILLLVRIVEFFHEQDCLKCRGRFEDVSEQKN